MYKMFGCDLENSVFESGMPLMLTVILTYTWYTFFDNVVCEFSFIM